MGWLRITDKSGWVLWETDEAPIKIQTSHCPNGYDSEGKPFGPEIQDEIEVDHHTRLIVENLVQRGGK
jgi:hypothetical protein